MGFWLLLRNVTMGILEIVMDVQVHAGGRQVLFVREVCVRSYAGMLWLTQMQKNIVMMVMRSAEMDVVLFVRWRLDGSVGLVCLVVPFVSPCVVINNYNLNMGSSVMMGIYHLVMVVLIVWLTHSLTVLCIGASCRSATQLGTVATEPMSLTWWVNSVMMVMMWMMMAVATTAK